MGADGAAFAKEAETEATQFDANQAFSAVLVVKRTMGAPGIESG